MTSWQTFVDAEPELAREVRARFDAHRHKVLATLRTDGSPRVSGIETTFHDGELWLGMMAGSLKARDLQRDPRLALHSPSLDPPEDPTAWPGDAKLAGRGVEVTDPAIATIVTGDPEFNGHLFRVDIDEVVLIRIGDPPDHLVIELWRPGQPIKRFQRE